jgi:hypothetical protein
MDQRMFKTIAAVLLVLSFFFPRIRSQSQVDTPASSVPADVPSSRVMPTEEEYLRSLKLEMRWIAPSYILAIAGTFFMTLAMIFLYLRGTQLRRSPGCGKCCAPGWSFCCLIPIVAIIGTFIAEMVLLSSPTGIYLIYLEIILTQALRNPMLGVFFMLLMVYAIATFIGLIIFIIFAIQYANGRKRRDINTKVRKLSKSFSKGAQQAFQMGTVVTCDGTKEWAVIDLGHPEDESTVTTTSSSYDSDDLQETTDTNESAHTDTNESAHTTTAEEEEQSRGTHYNDLY